MERALIFPPGSVLTLTSGDRAICGQIVTTRQVDLREAAQEFALERAEMPQSERDYLPVVQPDLFPDWLVAKGYAVPLKGEVIHLGGYLSFADEFGIPDIVD